MDPESANPLLGPMLWERRHLHERRPGSKCRCSTTARLSVGCGNGCPRPSRRSDTGSGFRVGFARRPGWNGSGALARRHPSDSRATGPSSSAMTRSFSRGAGLLPPADRSRSGHMPRSARKAASPSRPGRASYRDRRRGASSGRRIADPVQPDRARRADPRAHPLPELHLGRRRHLSPSGAGRARRRPKVQASPAISMFRPAPSSRLLGSSRKGSSGGTRFSSEAGRVNRMLQKFTEPGLKLGLGLLSIGRAWGVNQSAPPDEDEALALLAAAWTSASPFSIRLRPMRRAKRASAVSLPVLSPPAGRGSPS